MDRSSPRAASIAAGAFGRPRYEPFRQATAAAAQALETLKQDGVRMIEIDRTKLTNEVKPLWKSFTDQYPDTKPVLQAILAETGKTA